jgi:PAS domain S-box-containing protein
MEKAFRKIGVDIIGDAPWGTHLCQFYETREDLVDILVPYFKAGLENNEFCMWITSEPLKVEDAKAALKNVVKNLDHFIKKGQIEILDYSEWYTKSGKFDAENVLRSWVEKENRALKRGYDGLRLSGNTFWLAKRDWRNFTAYEEEVNNVIGKYRMIAICTYSLGQCGASKVMDVISNHQFALMRREGKWVIIESSARKRAEEALRESKEKYQALLETINDAVYAVDLSNVITYISPAIKKITKYEPEELIGKNFFVFVHEADREKLRNRLRELFEGVVRPFEYRMVDKDGLTIWVRSFSVIVRSESGTVVSINGVLSDITERKRAELERERLLADLEAKNRELEAFVYTISHDLKAPLVSLNGFSAVLQKEYESQLGEEGKHCLERIQANAALMDTLIASLLELSRIGKVVGTVKEIDVVALLKEIRGALAVRPEEAGAEFVVQEPLPTVHADRDRIRQVFINLIDNAVKFRSAERALHIEVGCRQEGDFYRFHVADNGIGLASQYHEQIFAPFRKLHPEIEGAGIGLALVKKIVEHHGGRVWVESPSAEFTPSQAEGIGTGNEGAGATFYFTLPKERRDKPSRRTSDPNGWS